MKKLLYFQRLCKLVCRIGFFFYFCTFHSISALSSLDTILCVTIIIKCEEITCFNKQLGHKENL